MLLELRGCQVHYKYLFRVDADPTEHQVPKHAVGESAQEHDHVPCESISLASEVERTQQV